MKIIVIEDYFDKFLNERGYNGRSHDKITISQQEYNRLIKIAEKYEVLAQEHKRIKSKNDELLKELDDLKQDARNFRELEEEKEKYLQSLLRVKADFENYQKRNERENQRYKDYIMENILKKLVNHYDDLNRALNLFKVVENNESLKKGFEMLVKNFEKVLEEENVKPMNCEGEVFDPYKHEALMTEEGHDNLPENTILEELDKGYFYKEKILKPARVKISKKSKLKKLEENNKTNGSE